MMEFIIMTGSFTLAILLAGVVSVAIMLQPKVMKWYMKLAFKSMSNMDQIAEELIETKDL